MRTLKIAALLSALATCTLAQTPPTVASFAWINQGACSANNQPSGKMVMFHPGAPGVGFNWCTLQQALPAAPYTVVIGLTGHVMSKAASLGVVLRDDVSGKLIVYSAGQSDTGVASLAGWKMLSPTVYQTPSSPYYTYSTPMVTGGLLPKYVRIRDNGTHRTVAVSQDGETYLTIHIALNTDFILPTHWGLALRGTGDNVASMMIVQHVAITTP